VSHGAQSRFGPGAGDSSTTSVSPRHEGHHDGVTIRRERRFGALPALLLAPEGERLDLALAQDELQARRSRSS
jgi:hypothetical protein